MRYLTLVLLGSDIERLADIVFGIFAGIGLTMLAVALRRKP